MKSITTISMMPKELLENLETKWKFDLLGVQSDFMKDALTSYRRLPLEVIEKLEQSLDKYEESV